MLTGTSIENYLGAVQEQLATSQAAEHAYRPALQHLMDSIDGVRAVNDPKRSKHGAPDFVFLRDGNKTLILGYAEAKDIDNQLDAVERTEQMQRYSGYANLFLTNYVEFRFYRNGERYHSIAVAKLVRLP